MKRIVFYSLTIKTWSDFPWKKTLRIVTLKVSETHDHGILTNEIPYF